VPAPGNVWTNWLVLIQHGCAAGHRLLVSEQHLIGECQKWRSFFMGLELPITARRRQKKIGRRKIR